ncbi:SGNH/GDSL hydrolase family protein [Arthrobacter sp. STN4]|uniref:SGNH/GDSL hydrolase family protein n=1 Tax=Arthrobacter sp. STN4 TaxID=2923276 RepID=UPI00211A6B2C|nr:SGNH/GDSL hydrolase family protein [Arthrobacter sp. STN4]MCQ9164245.1 SGNH/GDSL hydrolase family protein [Arthrobacter sp. STN4]
MKQPVDAGPGALAGRNPAGQSLLRRAGRAAAIACGAVAGLAVLTVLEGLLAYERLALKERVDAVPATGYFGRHDDGREPLRLALLGDSLAVGYGAAVPEGSVGYMLADGLAAATGRPVTLDNVALIGATSEDLVLQVAALDARGLRPDVAVIIVGGNDILHLRNFSRSLAALAETVRALRRRGSQVVLASCPDLGTVSVFLQPLRFSAHWMSLMLATGQTIVVLRNGGRTVSLADLLGPIFRRKPKQMFSTDRLHPSAHGYAQAAMVMLPSVVAAAGYNNGGLAGVPHRVYRKGRRRPLAWFAFRASRRSGTEVRLVSGRRGRDISVRHVPHVRRKAGPGRA